MHQAYPTETDIRGALIERATQFKALTGTSFSAIGKQALNDTAFLSQVQGGANFTVERYSRLMGWLDRKWPVRPRKRRGRAQGASA